ncbi:MAG TPA: hypothetical protein VGL01_01015 [Trinickia sp.]|uniref:hypothetical protein n=1 Tax=Trinickia sp. TaxID=2571163 RepID=UPI002F40D27A
MPALISSKSVSPQRATRSEPDSRKLGWDNIAVRYVGQHERQRTGAALRLPSDVDKLPTRSVGRFVERLAQAYGIQYRRSGLDDFAEAVTRAAGDDVELDFTGKLLVALKKQNRINGRQFARLMATIPCNAAVPANQAVKQEGAEEQPI